MNRLILLAIFFLFSLTPVNGIAEKSLADCAVIKDATARLTCFDKLAGAGDNADTTSVADPAIPTASTQATPPTPVESTKPTPEPIPAQALPKTDSALLPGVSSYQDIFGLENQAAAKGIKQITSRVISDFDGWDGKTVFRLENGQVWMQKDVNSRLSWRGSSHPIATIRRKTFNSYLFKVEGTNKSVRVIRVK